MADRFLSEIRDMHQLRKDIRLLPLAKAKEFMKRLRVGHRSIQHTTRYTQLSATPFKDFWR